MKSYAPDAENLAIALANTTSPPPHLQNVCTTDISVNKAINPTPPSNATPTPPPVSAIEAYVQTLKTQGKDQTEVLQTLKLCYEDPPENVASMELEDF